MLVHIIADYGFGDLAFAEVLQRIKLAFAPGSSGWTNAQGEEMRWMELFLRSGNACDLFDRPSVGAQIQIS